MRQYLCLGHPGATDGSSSLAVACRLVVLFHWLQEGAVFGHPTPSFLVCFCKRPAALVLAPLGCFCEEESLKARVAQVE